MNKKELFELLARKTNISENKVRTVMKELKNIIIEVLNKGGQININDFGKLTTKETKERICRNPITKRYIFCEKKRMISIKLFKNFKYSIR